MILPIKKILCPTDFSDPSYEGLKAAAELARHFEADLVLVHAVNPMPVMPGSLPSAGGYFPTVLKEIEESAKNSMETILQTQVPAEVRAQTLVIVGTSAQVITQAAIFYHSCRRHKDTTVIYTGTHMNYRRDTHCLAYFSQPRSSILSCRLWQQ